MNYYAVLEPTPVKVTTPVELLSLVESNEPKAVSVAWRSVSKDVVVKHRIRKIVSMKTVNGRTLITFRKSIRRCRSFYVDSITEVTVD